MLLTIIAINRSKSLDRYVSTQLSHFYISMKAIYNSIHVCVCARARACVCVCVCVCMCIYRIHRWTQLHRNAIKSSSPNLKTEPPLVSMYHCTYVDYTFYVCVYVFRRVKHVLRVWYGKNSNWSKRLIQNCFNYGDTQFSCTCTLRRCNNHFCINFIYIYIYIYI